MKKILTIIAIALFTINVGAQEIKPATQEKEAKSCSKHDAHAKKMTEEEISACKAKCKAEGKKCEAKEMTKCKKEDKKCASSDKKKDKKCCAKKE